MYFGWKLMDICTIDSSHVGSSDESMSQQQIKYSKGKTRFSIVKKIKVAAKAFYENGIIIDRVVPESVLPYFPIVLLGLAVAVCEIVSASMMFSYSGIYGAIAEGNTTAFWEMIFLSFSLSLTQACAEATKIYCRDNLALIWRRQLIEELERAANKTLFTSAHHPEQLLPPIDHYHSLDPTSLFFTHLGAVSNLDQRVTQDASELCTTAAKIVASIIVLPFVVVFYAYYLTVAIGIASPFLCLLFFLISLVVSYQFAKRVSPVIFEQGRLEGEFRLHWTQIMTQWGLITIWQGGNKEIIGSKQRFSDLWKNQRLLLWRQWKLNLVTQGFQYSGAVVTYIIVGLSVLYFMAVQESSDIEQDNDSMASKAIIRWTRGSYAAMALIHAFTTVTDAMGWYSTATGLANRVLVVFYAAKQAWTTESVSENKDSNLSDRCCCVVSTSDEYSKASSEEDNHPLKETEYNSNEKSSQLDRVYQSDPWGLWTLIEEIKRSRTIHQALTTTQSQLHSMQSPDRPSLYDRRPLGSTIQLQPWKSPISKEQSGPFATKSTPFAAALGGDDDDKSATDGTEQLLQGLHLEGAASQSEIEAGYAALFHQRMQSLPLRPHLNKGSVDAEEDLELSDDSHMQSGFLPIYDAYDYDNRFGKLSRVFEELQNRVHTSILQPIELFKVYEYSLYCPIPKCYSATDESVTHTGKTHDASQGSINAVDPPKRLLIAQLTFSMTSHMRLLISGPTGTGKSTLLFALTQQLRCMSTYAPQQSRSGFQHIVVPLQQLADRFRVLHCPQTPYVLTEASLLENVFYPKTLHIFQQQHQLTAGQELKEKHQVQLAEELLKRVWLLPKSNQPTDDKYIFSSCISEISNGTQSTTDPDNSSYCVDRSMHSKAAHLSLGEQQCLMIARLLFHYIRVTKSYSPTLHKVQTSAHTYHSIILLDEVTSAMDEECEGNTYRLLQEFIPSYISVGHRSTIRPYHTMELKLSKQNPAAWKLNPLK